MKVRGHIEKWGVGVLGAVSLALLVNLLLQFNRMPAGNARPRTVTPARVKVTTTPVGKATTAPNVKAVNAPADKAAIAPGAKATTSPSAAAKTGKPKVPDELSRYDPILKLDLLKELEDRPLPELSRNPFEFVGLTGKGPPAPGQTQQTTPVPAPQPPPPPPVTLKPMGYSEGAGGVKEAMVSDEDQIFVVHEGDTVGTRYKIIKITSTVITVEDATQHQTVDLPIPQ